MYACSKNTAKVRVLVLLAILALPFGCSRVQAQAQTIESGWEETKDEQSKNEVDGIASYAAGDETEEASSSSGTVEGTKDALTPLPGASRLYGGATEHGFALVAWGADDLFEECYDYVVRARIVPLEFPAGEPMEFGPWTARKEYGAPDAAEDGSLTVWAKDYYITHDWSDYGQQILQMCPGDSVTINGVKLRVKDAFDYPKNGYLEEIRHIVGEDTVVIQTCEPSSSLNRIVYGRPISN